MKWQPIETAPKDGTEFIVFYPSFTSQQGWCYGEDITSARYEKGELVSFSDYTPATPTHWMPLPEAPNAKVTGDSPAFMAKRPVDCRVMPATTTENGNEHAGFD